MTVTFVLAVVLGAFVFVVGIVAVTYLRHLAGDTFFQAFAVLLLVLSTAASLWLALG